MRHGYLIDMDGVLYRGSELIPGADRFVSLLRSRGVPFCFLTKRHLTALDGALDGLQKHVVAEWLGQEFHCPSLHGLDGGRYVAVACDEDDRHVRPIDDPLLEIETIEIGQRHIEHQAARNIDTRPREKLLGGRECLGLPAGVADQQLQRFAYRYIVVNDEHDWQAVRHGQLARSAALIAFSRAVSLNGFNRHSTAPSSSTRGRRFASPWAVMKTIGISRRRRVSSRWRS